jgi:hemoglobin
LKKEIKNRDDIALLVVRFHKQVKGDDLIGDIFTNELFFRFDTHIPIMSDFWESVLLGSATYRGNTKRLHIELNKKHPLKPEHFARWKKLFFETLDEHFTGANTGEAKKKAELMEALMQAKIAQSGNPNFIQ